MRSQKGGSSRIVREVMALTTEAVTVGSPARVSDLVFALSFTTWTGAVRRGLCMPEDRLAAALPSSPRVRRLLVSNPYRSLPVVLARAALRQSEEPYAESTGVRLHQPLRLRRFDSSRVAAIERSTAEYERSVQRAARRLGLEAPAVITTHPLLAGFGRFEWARTVTYYGWDDFSASEPHRRWWPAYREAFERIRLSGRRVVGVSEGVLDRIRPTGASAVIPNGIEASEWLDPGPAPAWFIARPRPRLLYLGTLDARLDANQLRGIAAAYPGGSVSLVGPVQDEETIRMLDACPNLHVYPPVQRSVLPGLVTAADACLVPHVRSAFTEAMSPLKLYEYLAAGRPVAAVDLPPIVGVSDRVALAGTGSSLVPAVEQALALGPASEGERRGFILENDWGRRFERILDVALAD